MDGTAHWMKDTDTRRARCRLVTTLSPIFANAKPKGGNLDLFMLNDSRCEPVRGSNLWVGGLSSVPPSPDYRALCGSGNNGWVTGVLIEGCIRLGVGMALLGGGFLPLEQRIFNADWQITTRKFWSNDFVWLACYKLPEIDYRVGSAFFLQHQVLLGGLASGWLFLCLRPALADLERIN